MILYYLRVDGIEKFIASIFLSTPSYVKCFKSYEKSLYRLCL